MDDNKRDKVAEGVIKVFPEIVRYFFQLRDEVSDPLYTYQDFVTLHILEEFGRAPISAVGKILMISKSRMTVLVDKLLEAQLIERVPDQEDRRIINIALTDKGKELAVNNKQNLKIGISKRFAILSDEESEQFIHSLMIVQQLMSKTESGDKKL
ncbi:MarR family winged helix-turn-helix transcriptional regulator [Paenibacillus sp. BAC0078]